MSMLIKEDLCDKKFIQSCTMDFEALKAHVADYPPERAAKIAGIPAEYKACAVAIEKIEYL